MPALQDAIQPTMYMPHVHHMFLTLAALTICLASFTKCGANDQAISQTQKSIETRTRYLLLDQRIIAEQNNATLELGEITKHPENPLFAEDMLGKSVLTISMETSFSTAQTISTNAGTALSLLTILQEAWIKQKGTENATVHRAIARWQSAMQHQKTESNGQSHNWDWSSMKGTRPITSFGEGHTAQGSPKTIRKPTRTVVTNSSCRVYRPVTRWNPLAGTNKTKVHWENRR